MCPGTVTKGDNSKLSVLPSDLNPPIITHTAATPMTTPQGSPNEHSGKETNNKTTLTIRHPLQQRSLSLQSSTSCLRPSPNVCLRASPRLSLRVPSKTSLHPSPRLQRSYSYGSRRNSWKGRRSRDGDRLILVHDSQSDSVDEDDDVFKPNLLTRSYCNAIDLHRQSSFNSHRTVNSLTSGGSGKDDYKQNNLSDLQTEIRIPCDKLEDDKAQEDEDPDAMDETNCWSWCPEPMVCCKARHEYVLFILPPDSRIRKLCQHFIAQKWFDNTILFFIALNCITLAMERPDIPPASGERRFLIFSNYGFTVIFAMEMFFKVVAKGLFLGKHAYLKSGWNVMDGFLVIISLVDIVIALSASSSPRIFGILRVFRLLRTLRPLRVISRAPGLKLVVQTLLSSLRPIGNIVLICCTFFIIFGILGVQLFKGTFFHCKGPTGKTVRNKTECLEDPRNFWLNQKYNFDNLGQALMALFVLASKDGWVSIMYTGLDAVGIDQQPIENYSEWRLVYFISFLLLVGFFVLNMFVGVVVENFHKCRENQEIEERARRATKRAQKLEQKRKSEGPNASNGPGLQKPPYWAEYSRVRLLIHTVVSSKYFDLAIAGVIGLNVISMAMEYYMMPPELEFALKIFNYFFTSVFILEATMKITALGLVRYIKDRWNQLDILIVLLSVVGIILEEMKTNVIPINPTIIRVMRVLRIARVLKLLKMAKGIRALLDTVIQALPQVGNLGLLFFLLFFIFAALGVELFGRLECSEEHPCEGLGVHAHFRDFGMAFLTLFRIATGDNWNGIMKDTLREDCSSDDDCLKNCCVSPLIAPVYFVVFVLMAQFVLVNVVVAVLMKHLEETYKYKELDDELEEELRLEMEEHARAAKQEAIELQESHRALDGDEFDTGKSEGGPDGSNPPIDSTVNNYLSVAGQGDRRSSVSRQVSLPPSFTFRPPSDEPPCLPTDKQMVLPNITISMEMFGSEAGDSDMQLSVQPTLGSVSSCSDYSVQSNTKSETLSLPVVTYGSPWRCNERRSSRKQRRPLVRQFSMDCSSDQQQNEQKMSSCSPGLLTPEPPQRERSQSCGRSQPPLSLLIPQPQSLESSCSEFSVLYLPKPKAKHSSNIQRSQSSGAEHAKFRDIYTFLKMHSKSSSRELSPSLYNSCIHTPSPLTCSHTSNVSDINSPLVLYGTNTEGPIKCLPQHMNSCSECDNSTSCEWEDEDALCDEEVKMITGESEDDDIKPTMVYASNNQRQNTEVNKDLTSNINDGSGDYVALEIDPLLEDTAKSDPIRHCPNIAICVIPDNLDEQASLLEHRRHSFHCKQNITISDENSQDFVFENEMAADNIPLQMRSDSCDDQRTLRHRHVHSTSSNDCDSTNVSSTDV
ncbi:hypothetical protein ScPMuIL_004420 [Solemya velum]